MQILILDTDDAFRESLSRLLQEAGHTVAIARNLLEAKSHCSPGGSDLMFLDFSSQPDMLSIVREHNPDILVVIMSLNPSIESVIVALRLGAFDYLIKPFADTKPLMQSIERARRSIEAASCQRVYLKRILQTFSDLNSANANIRELGYTDGTTELYFNQYFEDILAIELARSRRCNLEFSIVSVKLDYLQDYMSPETNAVFRSQIEAIAGCLRQRLRRTDVLARTGIDEFMIILPETPKEGGLIVIESFRKGIAAIVPAEITKTGQTGGDLPFAFGTAAYPLDGMECQVLMGKARQYS